MAFIFVNSLGLNQTSGMKFCFLLLILSIFGSCSNDKFCECYKWRDELFKSYDSSKSAWEKTTIEMEMYEFDQECLQFHKYIDEIDTEEELEEYQKRIKECEN